MRGKISQLLWEYMEEKKKNPEQFLEISTALMTGSKVWDVYIVSKEFWFIEWLVQNDKVDRSYVLRIWYEMEEWNFYHYDDYYNLLMLLAIQDEPVKFLSEILK